MKRFEVTEILKILWTGHLNIKEILDRIGTASGNTAEISRMYNEERRFG